MTGFEMILPFLKPIQAYILDPDVSESVALEPSIFPNPVLPDQVDQTGLADPFSGFARQALDKVRPQDPIEHQEVAKDLL